MPKVFALVLLLILPLAGGYAIAQEAEDDAEVTPVAEVEDSAAAGDDDSEAEPDDDTPVIDLDDPDNADLDRQTYNEDDDDFVPTEEIPADEAIPFPSDI